MRLYRPILIKKKKKASMFNPVMAFPVTLSYFVMLIHVFILFAMARFSNGGGRRFLQEDE